MSEGLLFKKAGKEDLPRISEFRKGFFQAHEAGRSCEPEYYEWKCCRNPFQEGEIWLAEEGNRVVGMKTMTPKPMKILGTMVNAAETGDTFAHPDCQRRGIFTGLFQAAKEGGLDPHLSFIYGLPSKISLQGYERKLDYAQIPVKLRSMVKPVRSKQILKRKLRFSFVAAIVSPLLDIASRAMFRMGTRGMARSTVDVRLEQGFPDDIDALWEEASVNYDVILVRSKKYLEWRYIANPDAYTILIARSKSGATAGYMVTKIHASNDLMCGYICDFLTLESDPNVFRKLLAAAVESFYQKGCAVVLAYVVKGSFYYRTLLRAGFLPWARHPIICYRNELGKLVLKGGHEWHFTMADSDGI